MKLAQYESYRPSFVERLGDLPSHWNLSRIKFEFKIKGGSTPKSTVDEYWSGDTVWVTPADLSNRESKFIADSKRKITLSGLKSCGSTIVPAQSLILSTRAPIGSIAIASSSLCTNQGCKALIPKKSTNELFFEYLMRVSTEQLNVRGKGTTFMELSADELGSFKIPFPPIKEQQAIATFLDHETARINTLIEKQEQLIALLKEKRQAVISRAVTKGLDPTAPMKESGVEWLGEVPEHWKVIRLKYLGTARNGLTYSPDDVVDEGDGILVLRSSNVQNKLITLDDNVFVKKKIPARMITKVNDILVCSRNGSRTLIGKNALIDNKSEGLAYGAFMMIYRSELNPYLFFVFNSTLFDYQSGTFLTSTINQLTVGNIDGFEVPLPPNGEREEIVNYLKNRLVNIDSLIEKTGHTITLMKERRTALISAAVTGKIDVRNHPSARATA